MSKLKDEELLAALYSPDDEQYYAAFKTLHEDLDLRRMVRNMMNKHPHTTEEDFKEIWDSTMEGLVKALAKNSFLSKSKLSTYIFSIAKNQWLTELERRARFAPLDWLPSEKETVDDPDFELGLADTDEEYQQIITEAIQHLSPRCQGMLKDALAGRSSDFLTEEYEFSSKGMAKKESYRCRGRLRDIIRSKPALHQKLKDLLSRK